LRFRFLHSLLLSFFLYVFYTQESLSLKTCKYIVHSMYVWRPKWNSCTSM
jgi:hypothetical protein